MERFNASTSQYREKSVYHLLSLKGKTVVITGRYFSTPYFSPLSPCASTNESKEEPVVSA
jgi:hypothetical protein